jgi:hypothetical protein
VALIFWLYRRSFEPTTTDVICYWKPPNLAAGKNTIMASSEFGRKRQIVTSKGDNFRRHIIAQKTNHTAVSLVYYNKIEDYQLMYMDRIKSAFMYSSQPKNVDSFLLFMKSKFTPAISQKIASITENQSTSQEWYQYRSCRITASKIYEAAHCNTVNDSLVDSIMYGKVFNPTAAKTRGIKLKKDVLTVLKKTYGTIDNSGIQILVNNPLFGASPDGINSEFIFEIKCLSKKSTVEKYIKDGRMKPKYLAQVSLLMKIANRKRAVFCIADSQFENNNRITNYHISLNEVYVQALMAKAELFWKKNVYSKIPIPFNLESLSN